MNNIFKISDINTIFNKPYDRLLRLKIMEIFDKYYISDIIDRLFTDSLSSKRGMFNLTVSYGVGVMYAMGMCIKNYGIAKEPFDKNFYKNSKKTIKKISIGSI